MSAITTTLSPKCAAIRFGISFWRACNAERNSVALASWVLYGELFSNATAFALAACSSSLVRANPKCRNVSLSSTRSWSKKAYVVSMRCPKTTCPSSCPITVAKLASSGKTSIKPRLSTIVWPSVNDSKVVVIKTRQRTSGSMSRLLVTSRLLTTVSRTLSTSPRGAINPIRCKRSATFSSAWRSQERCACTGVKSLAVFESSCTEPSTRILLNSCSCPACPTLYPQRRVCALKSSFLVSA